MDMMDEYAPPEDIISDILTAMCHAVTRTIELIPSDRRRVVCAYAIKEIIESGEQRTDDRSALAPSAS
jgi:hypothetical protein